MNREHCPICDEIEPRENELRSVKTFIQILDNLSRKQSYERIARRAYAVYQAHCFKYNEQYLKRDRNPLPSISEEIILYHLKNHNKSHYQVLFSMFEQHSKQVKYYGNKIDNLQNRIDNPDNDVVMADGDDFNIGDLKKELDRYQQFYSDYVNMTLKVDKSLNSIKKNF